MKAIIIGLFSLIAVVTCSARNDFWLGKRFSVTLSFSGQDLGQRNAPTPVSLPMPEYPAEMMRASLPGVVNVAFRVDLDGSVSDVRVLGDAVPVFDTSVRIAVVRWKFRPSVDLKDREPVVSEMKCCVHFEVKEDE